MPSAAEAPPVSTGRMIDRAEPTDRPAPASTAVELSDLRADTFAQILHDEPLQLVIAAMLNLDGMPPQYRLPVVTRSVDLLERAVDRQRQLVHAMGMPGQDDDVTVRFRRDARALLHGRTVTVEITGDDVPRLDPAIEAAVRDILFAALAGIRQSATVATVRLAIRADSDQVAFALTDDSAGRLPPAPWVTVPGLGDLQSRLAAVGGTLDTGPGLVFTLPVGVVAPPGPFTTSS